MCKGKGTSGTNCQCDGNCQCGKVVAPGIVSCENCGWKAPVAYNTLSNKFVCPSCRTESSFSSMNVKPNNNKTMNNQNQMPFPAQGMVALATGFPGGGMGIDASKTGVFAPFNESSFFGDISSQRSVGYAIGQEWIGMEPFKNYVPGQESSMMGDTMTSEEKASWLEVFNRESEPVEVMEMDAESAFKLFGKEVKIGKGKLGGKLKSAFVRFTPQGIILRDSYCGKYCKSLGYARKEDKTAFKRCKAACKTNYLDAKSGKWKYPAAPEGIEENLSPADIAASAAKEAASVPSNQKEDVANKIAGEEGSVPSQPKSKTWIYVTIGAVVLVAIIIAVVMMRRRSNK